MSKEKACRQVQHVLFEGERTDRKQSRVVCLRAMTYPSLTNTPFTERSNMTEIKIERLCSSDPLLAVTATADGLPWLQICDPADYKMHSCVILVYRIKIYVLGNWQKMSLRSGITNDSRRVAQIFSLVVNIYQCSSHSVFLFNIETAILRVLRFPQFYLELYFIIVSYYD